MNELIKLINKYKTVDFERGKTDCCMFAADAIIAQVGIDIASDYRGKYTNKAEAIELMKKYGTIPQQMDKHFKRIDDINFAQRGDIVELEHGAGVVWSGGVLSMHKTKGLVMSTDEIVNIWAINHE